MKFKEPDGQTRWEEALKINDNGRIETYGGSCIWFCEHWADAIEKAMNNGESLESCAERLEREILKEMGRYSLTGFQYGFSVYVLSKCWLHGEELRKWHNLRMQFGTEGEEANKTGGVLNPALINIKGGKQ